MGHKNLTHIWTRSELLNAIKGEDVSNEFLKKKKVYGISIDSRTINPGDLFFALIGENLNGHDYIDQAIKKGASGVIVSDKIMAKNFSGLYVEDTYIALKKLAKESRRRFKGIVISITGSNGKTSTKSMMQNVLNTFGPTHSTFENNNNLLGLSLTLSRLKKQVKFCVLELGISQKNEMKELTNLALPNIAIITNVSSSHIQNFKNEKQIAKSKSQIFLGLIEPKIIILHSDHKWFNFLKTEALKFTKRVYTYGKNCNSDLIVKNIDRENFGTKLNLENNFSLFFKKLPTHQIMNVCGILLIVRKLKLNEKLIYKKLTNLEPIHGRGNNFKISINNSYKKADILNDSYNANFESMVTSLVDLHKISKIKPNLKIVIIIGDMLELGEKSIEMHLKLIPYIENINPRCLVLIGKFSKLILGHFKDKLFCKTFNDTLNLKKEFFKIIKPNDLIFVKGSNGIGLYNFCNYLYNNFKMEN